MTLYLFATFRTLWKSSGTDLGGRGKCELLDDEGRHEAPVPLFCSVRVRCGFVYYVPDYDWFYTFSIDQHHLADRRGWCASKLILGITGAVKMGECSVSSLAPKIFS